MSHLRRLKPTVTGGGHNLVTGMLLAVFTSAVASGQTLPASQPPTAAQVAEWLEVLKPLPKVHYAWSIQRPLAVTPNDPRLYHYVRITHVFPLSSYWTSPKEIGSAVITCRAVNATKPSIPATLSIVWSPWHYKFGDDRPPTDFGPSHRAEIEFFREKHTLVKRWLTAANARHHADVRVSALVFDSEQFTVKPGDDAWNNAMTRKYNEIYDVAKEMFPDAQVIWYARGLSSRFTLKEKGDAVSCDLFRVPDIADMRGYFRRTVRVANRLGVKQIIPFVAMASGYRRTADAKWRFDFGWNYDLRDSWQIGAELNNPWYGDRPAEYAPWNRATAVFFFPHAFDARSPYWARHFVAYVRGAHGIRELP
ncbi:MAG TPA: hypothetical protein VMZ31_20730 [Phycisphaerae bacterium]|nr:hypothetical protein [Phycisphaerae bacterium]